jgi:hypothetical protein
MDQFDNGLRKRKSRVVKGPERTYLSQTSCAAPKSNSYALARESWMIRPYKIYNLSDGEDFESDIRLSDILPLH